MTLRGPGVGDPLRDPDLDSGWRLIVDSITDQFLQTWYDRCRDDGAELAHLIDAWPALAASGGRVRGAPWPSTMWRWLAAGQPPSLRLGVVDLVDGALSAGVIEDGITALLQRALADPNRLISGRAALTVLRNPGPLRGDQGIVRVLMGMLDSLQDEEGLWLEHLRGEPEGPRGLPAMLEDLRSSSPAAFNAVAAMAALSQVAEPGFAPVIQVLGRRMDHPLWIVGTAAVEGLHHLLAGAGIQASIRMGLSSLREEDRMRALLRAGRLPPRSPVFHELAPAVVELVQGGSLREQLAAARVLGVWGSTVEPGARARSLLRELALAAGSLTAPVYSAALRRFEAGGRGETEILDALRRLSSTAAAYSATVIDLKLRRNCSGRAEEGDQNVSLVSVRPAYRDRSLLSGEALEERLRALEVDLRTGWARPVGEGMLRGRESIDFVICGGAEGALATAVEIASVLQSRRGMGAAIGVNRFPARLVPDERGQWTVAGPGIERTRQIAALGESGGVLVSWEVARRLPAGDPWRSRLQDLGERQNAEGTVFRLYSLQVPVHAVGGSPATYELPRWRPSRKAAPSPWLSVFRTAWVVLMLLLIAGSLVRILGVDALGDALRGLFGSLRPAAD